MFHYIKDIMIWQIGFFTTYSSAYLSEKKTCLSAFVLLILFRFKNQ